MRRSERRPDLVAHLERDLGVVVTGGYPFDDDGQQLPFQVVEYESATGADDVVVSTLGLSRLLLAQPSGRSTRQELVTIAPRTADARSWLATLGQRVVADHLAVARGEVTGPVAPVAEDSTLTGFYFTAPTLWNDRLAVFDGPDGPVMVVLAIPVTTPEMSFVQTHGWSAFEDLLISTPPDVTDLRRASLQGVH